MSFTDQEMESFAEHTESVYYETSMTISNPPNGLFSETIKMGLSVSVPVGSTPELTTKYCKQQIDYELNKRFKSIMKGYKSEEVE